MILGDGFCPRWEIKGESNARYDFNYFIDFAVDRSASTLAIQFGLGLCAFKCFDFSISHYHHSITARQDITAEA